MTNPDFVITDLAVGMRAEKGVYAVLLAAGASVAAQVPTAWSIVRDLIRQEMEADGQPVPEDPNEWDRWYALKHGVEPDYSRIVSDKAGTNAHQRELLAGYFTASDADRASGKRVPAAAHRALAKLVKAGYVQVILTTNFDQLIEEALMQENVPFVTVTDAAEVAGASPLVRGQVQVVKLHGDYLKANIRNGEADLATYPGALAPHLARITEEYGLIVCGWSATWDVALRNAVMRSAARRYAVVWVEPYPLSTAAQEVVTARGARVVQQDADAFFTTLQRRVQALEESSYVAPIDLALVTGEVRLALRDQEGGRQRFLDLMDQLTARLAEVLRGPQLPWDLQTPEQAQTALKVAETAIRPLATVVAALTRHDPHGRFTSDLRQSLERVDFDEDQRDPYTGSGIVVHAVPAALLVYCTALAAVANSNLSYVDAVFRATRYPTRESQTVATLASIMTVAAQETRASPYPSAPLPVRASTYLRRASLDAIANFLNPQTREMDLNIAELIVAYAVEAAAQRGEQIYTKDGVWHGSYVNAVTGPTYIARLKSLLREDLALTKALAVEGLTLVDQRLASKLRLLLPGGITEQAVLGQFTTLVKGRA